MYLLPKMADFRSSNFRCCFFTWKLKPPQLLQRQGLHTSQPECFSITRLRERSKMIPGRLLEDRWSGGRLYKGSWDFCLHRSGKKHKIALKSPYQFVLDVRIKQWKLDQHLLKTHTHPPKINFHPPSSTLWYPFFFSAGPVMSSVSPNTFCNPTVLQVSLLRHLRVDGGQTTLELSCLEQVGQ